MTIDELIANKELPDTTPIKVGNDEIPLGALRQATTGQLAAIAERAKKLDERESAVSARQKEIMDLGTKAQEAYNAALELKRTASAATAPGAGSDPFADPWLAPVKSEMEKRDKELATLKAALENANKMLTNAATTWAEDRWDKEYESLDFGKREKDKRPSRDDLVKYAMENKLFDRRSMPSIKLAWEKQTEADRSAELQAAAEERGRQKGREEALAARIPPPGVPGSAPIPKGPNGTDKGDLGDLYAQAIQDPELRALIEQLPGGIS